MKLNKRQKLALLIGLGVFALMGLFPPFTWTVEPIRSRRTGTKGRPYTACEYRFLAQDGDIGFHRLVTQWVVVAAVTPKSWATLPSRSRFGTTRATQ